MVNYRGMHPKLVEYAVQRKISLGTVDGYYVIRNPETRNIVMRAHNRTVRAAARMLKTFDRRMQKAKSCAYWR